MHNQENKAGCSVQFDTFQHSIQGRIVLSALQCYPKSKKGFQQNWVYIAEQHKIELGLQSGQKKIQCKDAQYKYEICNTG